MSNLSPKLKSGQLFAAICGSLLMGGSVIPQAVLAQQTNQQPINQTNSQLNPCPKIFYEEPHNNQVAVPEGCPPNAYTQRLIDQGQLRQSNVPANPTPEQTRLGVGGETGSSVNPNPGIFNEAPYNRSQNSSGVNQSQGSGSQQPSSTRIAVVNGRISVRLINDTAATVTYQVIGDTAPRSLQGKSEVRLQDLNAPVTVTFQRNDGGLLQATPQASAESGVLEVRLKETTDTGLDRRAMRIDNTGSVYFN